MIFGYCRISNSNQSIERQVRNIVTEYPTARIYEEAYTGTKIDGRKEFNTLLRRVSSGDTIVFDSVSRMSRNAEDGINLYFKLYEQNVNLVFLKESYINTDVYRQAISKGIECDTGNKVADILLNAMNEVFKELAREQIEKAFEQSEKEVTDLHQRTKEGLETARRNGKQIGQRKGAKFIIQKAASAKEIIKKHSKCFGGTLSDKEVLALLEGSTYQHKIYRKNGEILREVAKPLKLSKPSYYKYKNEVTEELKKEQESIP